MCLKGNGDKNRLFLSSPTAIRLGNYWGTFLVACTQLYKLLCLSVGRSVGMSVAEDSEHATYGNWPCSFVFFLFVAANIESAFNKILDIMKARFGPKNSFCSYLVNVFV